MSEERHTCKQADKSLLSLLREQYCRQRQTLLEIRQSMGGIVRIISLHKQWFFIAFCLMLFTAALETLLLGLLMPFIDIFSGALEPSAATVWVTRLLERSGLPTTVPFLLAVFLGLVVVLSTVRYGSTVFAEKIRRKLFVNLNMACYRNLMRVGYAFFHGQRKSDLNLNLTYSSEAAHGAYDVMELLQVIVQTAAYFCFLCFLSIKLTVVVSLFALVTTFIFSLYTLQIHRTTKQITRLKANFGQHALEAIESIKVVKAFSNEEFEIGRYQTMLSEHERMYFTLNLRLARMQAIKMPLNYLTLVVVVLIAREYMGFVFSFIGVYLITLYKFMPLLHNVQDRFNNITRRLPMANLSLQLINPEGKPYLADGWRPFPADFQELRLAGVDFAYHRNTPVLRDISLTIRRNTTMAFVGQSGGGKSTLVDILLRLYDPQAGAILVDGTDLREFIIRSYLQQTALVTQDMYIFNDTVAENIRYGRLDATRSEIEEAAKLANAHGFITRLPQGYETRLGDRGVRLSGGQKQRVSLARALVRNSPILIL
ncbi:MAG TPA: ABC transporter ATP-binding protein, partial [bacterium]|nr:ABC transporter ATP-binding protein [bacterium]